MINVFRARPGWVNAGHAFIGEYTQRFFPPNTLQIKLPTNAVHLSGTIEHARHALPPFHSRAPQTPNVLMAAQEASNSSSKTPKRVQKAARFLEETRACNKPQAIWEPDSEAQEFSFSYRAESPPLQHKHTTTT